MQSDNFIAGGGQKPIQHKPRRLKKLIQRIIKFIKKFWYIFAVVFVIIVGLITWQILHANRESTWNKATDYFARAEYEEAGKLIKDFPVPDNPDRLRVYSQTMLATGEADKALTGYEALYKSTNDVSAKLIIGNIYNQKKDYDKAIGIYKEIIANNPNNTQAYVNIATIYRLQSKNTEAIAIAQEAVKVNPQNATLLELRVSMLLENQESAEFVDAVEALRSVNPNDPLLEALNQ